MKIEFIFIYPPFSKIPSPTNKHTCLVELTHPPQRGDKVEFCGRTFDVDYLKYEINEGDDKVFTYNITCFCR